MESAKNGHRTVAGRRSSKVSAESHSGRPDKTDPLSRVVNRSSRASRYSSFAEELLRDLDPRGPLQRLVADHVVQSAWKLKTNLETQAVRNGSDQAGLDAEPAKRRVRPTELDRASRSMRDALESLDYLRAKFPPKPEPEVVCFDSTGFEAEVLPDEWPILPVDEGDDLPEIVDDSDDDVPSWQERLVFDFEVSDVSPVVKGTWITVGQVVSLIVDGWAWSDILRTHPELTEDDIRTCVAYAMDEENSPA